MNKLRSVFLIGLAYVLPVVAFGQLSGGNTSGGISGGNTSPRLTNPLRGIDTLQGFVEAVLNRIVLPIGAVVVVIYIIYTGFLFVTAKGNESKLEEAKKSLLYVVIGTAILLGAVVISGVIRGTVCQITKNNLPGCPVQVSNTIVPQNNNNTI